MGLNAKTISAAERLNKWDGIYESLKKRQKALYAYEPSILKAAGNEVKALAGLALNGITFVPHIIAEVQFGRAVEADPGLNAIKQPHPSTDGTMIMSRISHLIGESFTLDNDRTIENSKLARQILVNEVLNAEAIAERQPL